MALKLKNLAASRLSQNISNADTFVTVNDGDVFPALDEPGDWYPAALVNDLAQTEFVRVTARNGNVLTVTRGQEGSTRRPYSAGDVIELRLTVAALDELRISGVQP